jgi:hypothetical protein
VKVAIAEMRFLKLLCPPIPACGLNTETPTEMAKAKASSLNMKVFFLACKVCDLLSSLEMIKNLSMGSQKNKSTNVYCGHLPFKKFYIMVFNVRNKKMHIKQK